MTLHDSNTREEEEEVFQTPETMPSARKSNEWYLWFSMHLIFIVTSIFAVIDGFFAVGYLCNGWTSPSTVDDKAIVSFQWNSSLVLAIVFFVCLLSSSVHTLYVVYCERDPSDPNLPAVTSVKSFCASCWFSALGYWALWTLADVLDSGDRSTLNRLDLMNLLVLVLAVVQMILLAATLLGNYSHHEPLRQGSGGGVAVEMEAPKRR